MMLCYRCGVETVLVTVHHSESIEQSRSMSSPDVTSRSIIANEILYTLHATGLLHTKPVKFEGSSLLRQGKCKQSSMNHIFLTMYSLVCVRKIQCKLGEPKS